jgi:hypothetical protein
MSLILFEIVLIMVFPINFSFKFKVSGEDFRSLSRLSDVSFFLMIDGRDYSSDEE